MSEDKAYLILPILIYEKNADGTKKITIGWLKKTYSITYGGNK
jgi:hypothetical protein